MQDMTLVIPAKEHLAGFVAALKQGWSPNNIRDVSGELLAEIAADETAFLAGLNAPPDGRTVELPDGQKVPRLPMLTRWLWDGEFCGHIGCRYVPGRDELPPYVLGHIGYAVVPWKRGKGYATRALTLMLEEARKVGLTQVEITCDPENKASQTVVTRNGGTEVRRFVNPAFGPHERVLYQIVL